MNGERRDFQHGLLLELQDIRVGADGELASALDHLIDIVRHSTPARNAETEEYDARIAEAVSSLSAEPSCEKVFEVLRLLESRNRRAKH